MDQIFDRLANLFKSLFNDDFDSPENQGTKKQYYDPDMQEAWEELNDYLDENKGNSGQSNKQNRYSSNQYSKTSSSSRGTSELNELKQDYANLEVPLGVPFADVKKSYKRLLRSYHPDKHAGGDPEKLKMATEISKKINQSYQKIKNFIKKYSRK